MNTIYFITQELCDEASLFIALQHDVNVKITRNLDGVVIESLNNEDSFPIDLITNVFLHYLRYHFLEEEELLILRNATVCQVQGKMTSILSHYNNYRNN